MCIRDSLDYIVYSAAAAGFSEAQYQAAYVAGVRNLLHALQKGNQQPRRLLFCSSTSVYAQHRGESVDEGSPAEADGFSGRCIRAGEELLWSSPWPAVAVRFGGIYGPGRTRLIDSVREGTAIRPAGPPLYTNRIHRDDCARVLEHLLSLTDADPLYVAVDDEPAPLDEVLGWLAHQLGVAAVSYTHLDVYKRQPYWRHPPLPMAALTMIGEPPPIGGGQEATTALRASSTYGRNCIKRWRSGATWNGLTTKRASGETGPRYGSNEAVWIVWMTRSSSTATSFTAPTNTPDAIATTMMLGGATTAIATTEVGGQLSTRSTISSTRRSPSAQPTKKGLGAIQALA